MLHKKREIANDKGLNGHRFFIKLSFRTQITGRKQ